MKKTTLSTIAALALSVTSANAMSLYQDAQGNVYTQAANGRTLIGDFVDTKELKASHSKPVEGHFDKIKFSGVHYLGSTSRKNIDPTLSDDGKFEIRRNYLQVKAYFNDKDYMRVTLDAASVAATGDFNTRVKYAYLYLDNVLPSTGMEFGLAHRPWLDYEEHAGWWHRAIQKTALETKRNADFTNSADFGVNFKTKTKYFTSEIGLFNGEGYHQVDSSTASKADDRGYSAEWRLTAVVMGDGTKKHKPTKDTYLEVSSFGQTQNNSGKTNLYDYSFAGVHAVYNMPSFLISAQSVVAKTDKPAPTSKQGSFWSVNADYRFGDDKKYTILARYDKFTSAFDAVASDYVSSNTIMGASYQMSKQVRWIASTVKYDVLTGNTANGLDGAYDYTDYMITAEVHW
jgi:hypothetical protein